MLQSIKFHQDLFSLLFGALAFFIILGLVETFGKFGGVWQSRWVRRSLAEFDGKQPFPTHKSKSILSRFG